MASRRTYTRQDKLTQSHVPGVGRDQLTRAIRGWLSYCGMFPWVRDAGGGGELTSLTLQAGEHRNEIQWSFWDEFGWQFASELSAFIARQEQYIIPETGQPAYTILAPGELEARLFRTLAPVWHPGTNRPFGSGVVSGSAAGSGGGLLGAALSGLGSAVGGVGGAVLGTRVGGVSGGVAGATGGSAAGASIGQAIAEALAGAGTIPIQQEGGYTAPPPPPPPPPGAGPEGPDDTDWALTDTVEAVTGWDF
jgi:hypothetical protein